ncbi:hypothetical protein AJ80_08647 [Polytolypa hystricis UAMH7299]|uniref:Rab-GAP TBC domain-containing protein n=1 Tax=Polytolypa hystricis (strain UAMH7299) TaxID=1447883 RepID=A0A2B7X4U7_POLH7|nr:hypothetical protein AJ80_08647 [Polytolypa hystricis UAMH7299]
MDEEAKCLNDSAVSEKDQVTQDSPSVPDTKDTKKREILQACDARDIGALARLATSEGGFLQDDIRKIVWPILLGFDRSRANGDSPTWLSLPRHGDEDQVKLDVNRSFVHYPNCPDKELDAKKEHLSQLITKVLRNNPILCYFQGYHDIGQVLLLVLGTEQAAPAFERISLLRIRDYMLPSLSPALKHLQLIPAILECSDPKLRQHLSGTKPFFALAATLTLYAHDIQEYSDIARLYDFILSYEPVVTIYLFAAIILSRKKELFEIPLDEPEMIHFTLSKLPQPLDLDGLIASTMTLYHEHPPERLPFRAWKTISRHSVLKTSRSFSQLGTLDEAVELFKKQTQDLRREEFRQKALGLLWKYRKPAGSIGLAIFIGVVAFWLAKNDGNASSMWNSCFNRLTNMFNMFPSRW